ncbi:hypothetical protein KP509_24G005100 [Ceratopteris richardii]|uniref:VQ domain-containing protein n=1 Tax=Ceratopteris richardii TaxID=49495 RepID=A0A8T2RUT9_CERRI|nr:hypothetical protein KP509_24G005100 [Ceratopteris richardii]
MAPTGVRINRPSSVSAFPIECVNSTDLLSASHSIMKRKPVVRIVQTRPPIYVQTDLTNFRDIVHQLTGRQSEDCEHKGLNIHNKSMEMEDTVVVCKKSGVPTAVLSSHPPQSPSISSSSTLSSPSSTPARSALSQNGVYQSEEQYIHEFSPLPCSLYDMPTPASIPKLLEKLDMNQLLSNENIESLYYALDVPAPLDDMDCLTANGLFESIWSI